MLNKTRVAVDITNSDVRVVSFQSNKIKKWMSSPIPAGLIKDGVIKDPRAMGILLDALFRSLKLSRSGIICTITGLPFIFRTINMPGMPHKIKIEAIERAARMEMSVSEEDMYLVWQLIHKKQQNQNEAEYFVVGVPRTALNPFIETLAHARIKASRIDIKPLALARTVSYKDALIISLEKEYFDIVLVYDGLIRVIHSFGNTIQPGDIIGLVNELVDGLNIVVKSFNRDFPQSEFPVDTPVLISGEMASNSSLLKMVQEGAGYPVSLINSALPLPPSMPAELYAACLGLVLLRQAAVQPGNRYCDISMNLLEGLKKRKTKTISQGYVLAVAAAIILIVLLFKINALRTDAAQDVKVLENGVAEETRKLDTAQKTNQEAEARKQAILEQSRLVDNGLKAAQGKNQVIKSLKSDFASSIVLIAGSLPENMNIGTIVLHQSETVITGTAEEAVDVLTLNENLAMKESSIEARVAGIDPLEEGGVSFQVIIVKKQGKNQ
jgi:hypothetical protein